MSRRDYMAYLLRLWREKEEAPWRALLENPNSGERIAFATLAELVAFLEEKTGERPLPSPPESSPPSTSIRMETSLIGENHVCDP